MRVKPHIIAAENKVNLTVAKKYAEKGLDNTLALRSSWLRLERIEPVLVRKTPRLGGGRFSCL